MALFHLAKIFSCCIAELTVHQWLGNGAGKLQHCCALQTKKPRNGATVLAPNFRAAFPTFFI